MIDQGDGVLGDVAAESDGGLLERRANNGETLERSLRHRACVLHIGGRLHSVGTGEAALVQQVDRGVAQVRRDSSGGRIGQRAQFVHQIGADAHAHVRAVAHVAQQALHARIDDDWLGGRLNASTQHATAARDRVDGVVAGGRDAARQHLSALHNAGRDLLRRCRLSHCWRLLRLCCLLFSAFFFSAHRNVAFLFLLFFVLDCRHWALSRLT